MAENRSAFCTFVFLGKWPSMKTLYLFLLGFAAGFLFNFYLMSTHLYGSLFLGGVFGLSYALAYFLDQPKFRTPMRLAITFGAALVVYLAASALFSAEMGFTAVVSYFVIAFGYNLMASFFRGKSVRNR